MSFTIIMDSDSDVPYQYAEKNDLPIISMPYILNGKEYKDDSGRSGVEWFFNAMREGAAPTTSLLTTEEYKDLFRPILDRGKDVLYIAFSSSMSATLKNAVEAREQLFAEEYKGLRIEIADTLSISMGVSVLAFEAVRMRDEGRSLDEVFQFIMDNRLNVQHWLMVDDLKYLRRGGRISATSAVFGTMLDIKPLLVVNESGIVEAHSKIKGRKKAIQALVAQTVEYIGDPQGKTISIIHADCLGEATRLGDMVREAIPAAKEVMITPIGPVVGAHAGPGTLAICFIGKPRSEVKKA